MTQVYTLITFWQLFFPNPLWRHAESKLRKLCHCSNTLVWDCATSIFQRTYYTTDLFILNEFLLIKKFSSSWMAYSVAPKHVVLLQMASRGHTIPLIWSPLTFPEFWCILITEKIYSTTCCFGATGSPWCDKMWRDLTWGATRENI